VWNAGPAYQVWAREQWITGVMGELGRLPLLLATPVLQHSIPPEEDLDPTGGG